MSKQIWRLNYGCTPVLLVVSSGSCTAIALTHVDLCEGLRVGSQKALSICVCIVKLARRNLGISQCLDRAFLSHVSNCVLDFSIQSPVFLCDKEGCVYPCFSFVRSRVMDVSPSTVLQFLLQNRKHVRSSVRTCCCDHVGDVIMTHIVILFNSTPCVGYPSQGCVE